MIFLIKTFYFNKLLMIKWIAKLGKNVNQKNSQRGKLQRKAFALVEVLVAISLLSATIITISALTISMMRANSLTHNHLIATELAREGIEITRNIRDTNWKNYRHWLTDIHDGTTGPYTFSVDGESIGNSNWNVSQPYGEEGALLYTSEALGEGYTNYSHTETDFPTPFNREITVTPLLQNTDGPDGAFDESLPDSYVFKVLVESKVWWIDRGNDREIKLYTELTDWNN